MMAIYSMAETYRLVHQSARRNAAQAVMDAPDGMWCKIYEPTRSDRQNAKLHAELTELIEQVPAMSEYSIEDVKLIFMNALRGEMKFLPCLDGRGQFPVGQKSSHLSKAQFAGLIELVHKYAAENGVVFKAVEYYEVLK
jgi:hypothetical protein